LIPKISPGELKITIGGKETNFALGEGLLTVSANKAVLLTDLAKTSSEIDEKAVLEAKKRAEEALSTKLSEQEYATTLAILDKSIAQLRVKRRHH
jgi:F-type H+-transporting ATPase subunit epsilon